MSESKGDDILAVRRIENQIFIDNTAYIGLFGENDFYKAAVYTDAPEYLQRLSGDLQTLLGGKVSVESSDALYRQMKAPLEQTNKGRGAYASPYLYSPGQRSYPCCFVCGQGQEKEMAVFISMGEKKIKIFLQAMLESAVLFLMAAMAACGLGTYTAGWLQSVLISSNTAQMELQISLQAEDMALLLAIGGAVVLLSVFLSVLPILRTNPRETLSRMEG